MNAYNGHTMVQGRNHVLEVGGPIHWSSYCTERNTDGIRSFVHCSLLCNGNHHTLHQKSWGGPSKFGGGSGPPRPPPQLLRPCNGQQKLNLRRSQVWDWLRLLKYWMVYTMFLIMDFFSKSKLGERKGHSAKLFKKRCMLDIIKSAFSHRVAGTRNGLNMVAL